MVGVKKDIGFILLISVFVWEALRDLALGLRFIAAAVGGIVSQIPNDVILMLAKL